MKAINFEEKFSLFTERWSPRVVAEMNDYQFKVVKIKDDFVWHKHDETDEVFIVIDGNMRIDFAGYSVNLKQGEMYVVPKGVNHKPSCEEECKVLLVEPKGVVNTGDEEVNDLTAPNDVWI